MYETLRDCLLRVLCCSSKEDLFLIETEFFSFDRTIKLSREVTRGTELASGLNHEGGVASRISQE